VIDALEIKLAAVATAGTAIGSILTTAAPTTNVTEIVCGLFDALASDTVIVAVYVAAVSDPVAGWTVSVPEFVPDPGVTVSQEASSDCDQLSVVPPWPVLLTATVCDAGLPPPAVAANDSDVGLRPIAGNLGTDYCPIAMSR
jgi:hypothetical protein